MFSVCEIAEFWIFQMVCSPLQLWMERGNALEGTRQTQSSSYVIGEVIQGWKGEEDEYVDIDSSDDDNKKGTTNQSSRDLIGTALPSSTIHFSKGAGIQEWWEP
jgi:hypothetical protein